jgi:hypothetical protein
LEFESESIGFGVVFEMVVLELVGESWELVVSKEVAIVDSFVGSLVFFGREG